MRLFFFCLLLVTITVIKLSAQIDSPVVHLPLVEVKEHKINATQNQIYSSNHGQNNIFLLEHKMQDLIQLFSGAYLRDNGNKTLGTLSIRGSSSQQTKVLWNGADIGNPMLGLSDISMLPPIFFDEIAISSTTGDEAYNPIGGALQLNTKLEDTTDYMLGYSGGQFNYHQGYFKGNVKVSPQFSIGLNAFTTYEEQNFPYKEEHQSVLLPDRQPHALHLQSGLLGEAKYKITDAHSVKISSWLQSLKREIPPLRIQRISEAVQSDTVIRGQFEWSSDWQNYQQSTQLTLRNESNAYRDPRNGIDDQNEFSGQQLLTRHKIIFYDQFYSNFGLNANWYQLSSPNYNNSHVIRSRFHLYFNPVYQLQSHPFRFDLAFRYNYDKGNEGQFTGHAKALWINKNHHLSIGFIRANRFPSFNDLYWVPAGNPELESELSHQWNLGYQYSYSNNKLKNITQANIFHKNVDNWILWSPIDQFIWSPKNILQVTSFGFDINQKISWQLGTMQALQLQLNFLYQSVTNTGAQHTPLAQKGNKLIYMPNYKLSGSLSWQLHDFRLVYMHYLRSKIYTKPDLSERLQPLSLGQLRCSYSIKIYNQKLQVFIQSHNLWNTTYYYQPDLPAPGIRMRAGLLIQKM